MLAGRFTSPTGVSVISAVDVMFTTLAKDRAVVVPSQASRMRSRAVSLSATANTRSASLLSAAKVSSASAQMLAATRMASVPEASAGAWKLICPRITPSVTVVSWVCRVMVPPAEVWPMDITSAKVAAIITEKCHEASSEVAPVSLNSRCCRPYSVASPPSSSPFQDM